MRDVRSNRLASNHREIPHVGGDEHPPFGDDVPKLCSIIETSITDFERAYGVDSPRPEDLSDLRREILVEVEPHPMSTTRAKPG